MDGKTLFLFRIVFERRTCFRRPTRLVRRKLVLSDQSFLRVECRGRSPDRDDGDGPATRKLIGPWHPHSIDTHQGHTTRERRHTKVVSDTRTGSHLHVRRRRVGSGYSTPVRGITSLRLQQVVRRQLRLWVGLGAQRSRVTWGREG